MVLKFFRNIGFVCLAGLLLFYSIGFCVQVNTCGVCRSATCSVLSYIVSQTGNEQKDACCSKKNGENIGVCCKKNDTQNCSTNCCNENWVQYLLDAFTKQKCCSSVVKIYKISDFYFSWKMGLEIPYLYTSILCCRADFLNLHLLPINSDLAWRLPKAFSPPPFDSKIFRSLIHQFVFYA